MKIKILKDTPFDEAGDLLSIKEFRQTYSFICKEQATDEALVSYLLTSFKEWFGVDHELQPADHPPLTVIIEGIVYKKEMDGLYHKFLIGSEYTPTNSIGTAQIQEVRSLINAKLYQHMVPYYTDNVNKKV